MKKLISTLAIALIAVFSITSCAPANTVNDDSETQINESQAPDTFVFLQKLPNGEEVVCVWAEGFRSGGLSCDWEGLHSESSTKEVE